MRAYGSKRCYHRCKVVKAGNGKKIEFTLGVKSRKLGRQLVVVNVVNLDSYSSLVEVDKCDPIIFN